MELHDACRPLAFLVGTWVGEGHGHYPTIEPFTYVEEVTFGHVGKPFLSYLQKTRHGETGLPLHAESGYLRAVGADRIEFVVVQPSGIVELHAGHVRDATLELVPVSVQVSPTAKTVTDVRRAMRVETVDGKVALTYDVSMAAVGQPLTHHLSARLLRSP